MNQPQFNLYGQGNFGGTPYQPIQGQGFGQFGMAQYMHNPPQNTQYNIPGNMGYQQQGGSFNLNMQTHQTTTNQYSNQQTQNKQSSTQMNFSLNTGNKPTQMKDDDDFGSF